MAGGGALCRDTGCIIRVDIERKAGEWPLRVR
jgi:hypothetical protein